MQKGEQIINNVKLFQIIYFNFNLKSTTTLLYLMKNKIKYFLLKFLFIFRLFLNLIKFTFYNNSIFLNGFGLQNPIKFT